MKKLLIFLMALVSLAVTTPAFAASSRSAFGAQQRKNRSIMDLPPYERAVLIIKLHETLHDSRKHWPYLGYGHRKLPGEKYFRGYKMSEQEADALLRKDLNKFIALFVGFKPMDALLLGVLSYNIGPWAVMKSSVYSKLKAGDRNIFKSYVAHCKYKGRFHKGLYKRRCQEFVALYVP